MGVFGWLPFGGSIAGMSLLVASVSYLLGLAWHRARRGAYAVTTVAAILCIVLARNWPDRAAALALAATTVSYFTGRPRSGTPS